MSIVVPGVDGPPVAIDDGGLTLKSDLREDGNKEPELTVALLEAKKCLSVEKNCPVVSGDWLGRMSWMQRWYKLRIGCWTKFIKGRPQLRRVYLSLFFP